MDKKKSEICAIDNFEMGNFSRLYNRDCNKTRIFVIHLIKLNYLFNYSIYVTYNICHSFVLVHEKVPRNSEFACPPEIRSCKLDDSRTIPVGSQIRREQSCSSVRTTRIHTPT